MDSPLHTRDQAIVKIVDSKKRTSSEEDKSSYISRKNYGDNILEYKRYSSDNYLEKGKTISGDYYANLLDQLYKNISENHPELAKKKVMFHQDNTQYKYVVVFACFTWPDQTTLCFQT